MEEEKWLVWLKGMRRQFCAEKEEDTLEGGRYIGEREIYWREGDILEGGRYI